jgi:hypothetical protein
MLYQVSGALKKRAFRFLGELCFDEAGAEAGGFPVPL